MPAPFLLKLRNAWLEQKGYRMSVKTPLNGTISGTVPLLEKHLPPACQYVNMWPELARGLPFVKLSCMGHLSPRRVLAKVPLGVHLSRTAGKEEATTVQVS